MDLAATRSAIATALSAVDGYAVSPRPTKSAPRPGDGWVSVSRVAPADFTRCSVTFVVVIVLGPDEVSAEGRLETSAVPLVDAVAALLCKDVVLEPSVLMTGTANTPLFAATLTLTMEVDP
jgi:hypothetical protein